MTLHCDDNRSKDPGFWFRVSWFLLGAIAAHILWSHAS